jgi:hypothetical protein
VIYSLRQYRPLIERRNPMAEVFWVRSITPELAALGAETGDGIVDRGDRSPRFVITRNPRSSEADVLEAVIASLADGDLEFMGEGAPSIRAIRLVAS